VSLEPLTVLHSSAGEKAVASVFQNSGTTVGSAATIAFAANTNAGAAVLLAQVSGSATTTTGSGELVFSTSLLGALTDCAKISQSGELLLTSLTGAVGYGTGSGGAVSQPTAKNIGVTLNAGSGSITMNAASLAANTAVSFTLTNSVIKANDVPVVAIKSGGTIGAYHVSVDAVAAGSCTLSLRNLTAGALAEAVVLSFAIIRGSIS